MLLLRHAAGIEVVLRAAPDGIRLSIRSSRSNFDHIDPEIDDTNTDHEQDRLKHGSRKHERQPRR